MRIPEEHLRELMQAFEGVEVYSEGGYDYLLVPSLQLPPGCSPSRLRALLCPCPRDGYLSRLYFSEKVTCPKNLNWNVNGDRILDRQWWAHSWQTPPNLRPIEMIGTHLRSFRD